MTATEHHRVVSHQSQRKSSGKIIFEFYFEMKLQYHLPIYKRDSILRNVIFEQLIQLTHQVELLRS
jgi:hypothetical protein